MQVTDRDDSARLKILLSGLLQYYYNITIGVYINFSVCTLTLMLPKSSIVFYIGHFFHSLPFI